MKAGSLIEKVILQSPAPSDDGYGGVLDGWEERFSCRAEFIYSGGGETMQAARMEGRGVLKIRLRSAENTRRITSDWRMVDARRGDVYNIKDVDAVTDRFWIYLLVERGVAA